MWDSLPTNAELFQRQSLTEEEMVNELSNKNNVSFIFLQSGSAGYEDTLSLTSLAPNDNLFCERFQLPLDELPLESKLKTPVNKEVESVISLLDWQSGKRCSLIDRDRPLVGSKSGRMYLTHR